MTVLIVDDEPLVRRALEKAFTRRQHEVVTAHDGDVGLVAWQGGQYDIVVLDVLMPGLTGPEILDAMAEKAEGSLNVLVSAYTGDYEQAPFHHQSVDSFFSKPFEDILALVDQCEKLWKEKFS